MNGTTSQAGADSSTPLVTIGLPFFNAERTLTDAIRSVYAQTYPAWHLLLVDDGSTDGSLAIARQIADPRVEIISDGINRGLIYRLNQISQLAQGDFLARLDSDDMMHPDRLSRQIIEFLQHPEVQVLGTGAYTIDSVGCPTAVRDNEGRFPPTRRTVLTRGLFIHPTVTARRSWALAHPYDADYFRAEDYELWCRISLRDAFLLDEPLYFYREPLPIPLSSYLASSATQRRVLRRYGPETVGLLGTGALLLRRLLADSIYLLSSSLGHRAQAAVLRSRNDPLSAAQRSTATRVLSQIRQTAVPGLSLP